MTTYVRIWFSRVTVALHDAHVWIFTGAEMCHFGLFFFQSFMYRGLESIPLKHGTHFVVTAYLTGLYLMV
jgi:hypothetical protein